MQVLQSWQRIASAWTEGNKCPETMEKNREVERHFGQATVLESKSQQSTSVSHFHHPMATTALSQGLEKPCELLTMGFSQRALEITPVGCPLLVSSLELAAGLKTAQCLWQWKLFADQLGAVGTDRVALLFPLCYSSLCKLQMKHSNWSLGSAVSTCTCSRRTVMVLFNCGNFY